MLSDVTPLKMNVEENGQSERADQLNSILFIFPKKEKR